MSISSQGGNISNKHHEIITFHIMAEELCFSPNQIYLENEH